MLLSVTHQSCLQQTHPISFFPLTPPNNNFSRHRPCTPDQASHSPHQASHSAYFSTQQIRTNHILSSFIWQFPIGMQYKVKCQPRTSNREERGYKRAEGRHHARQHTTQCNTPHLVPHHAMQHSWLYLHPPPWPFTDIKHLPAFELFRRPVP